MASVGVDRRRKLLNIVGGASNEELKRRDSVGEGY
jgi:hypothetical protein